MLELSLSFGAMLYVVLIKVHVSSDKVVESLPIIASSLDLQKHYLDDAHCICSKVCL